ncbi:MAG: hypothetical protein NVSMB9_25870 [Isosphaeraceae bacterium]
MLLLSWPLWVARDGFPQVPFVRAAVSRSVPGSWFVFLGLVASVVLTGLARAWRPWYAVSLGFFLLLILQDQHRFQPWMYQYACLCLFLAVLPRVQGLRYARWWLIALYVHSGLSKLDVSFCEELGPVFLRAALAPFGFDPGRWPGTWRNVAVLAMPATEIVVALLLAIPRTRQLGRLGAVLFHALLLGILGPAGLGHSTIVLIWNGALMVEVWLAFRPDLIDPPAQALAPRGGIPGFLVRLGFWVGVLMPLAERSGFWDVWPSHALYASHVERITVWLHDSELDLYPGEVRRHVLAAGDGPWRLLDLVGWSREARGTPVYPQNRACLGLAEALAARYGGRFVRVVAWGPADRWNGQRPRAEAVGPDAIRRLGNVYWLNARPAGLPFQSGQRPNTLPPAIETPAQTNSG